MGTALISNHKATTATQQFLASPKNLVEPGSKVQEAIWRLQDEVRILQEVLTRTRRALDQREVLLRNSKQRELELRAEAGDGVRQFDFSPRIA